MILLAPLYYQFAPLPAYPVRLGNYFAVIWIVLGFVALGLAAAQRPQAIAQAEEVFVEDEAAPKQTRRRTARKKIDEGAGRPPRSRRGRGSLFPDFPATFSSVRAGLELYAP